MFLFVFFRLKVWVLSIETTCMKEGKEHVYAPAGLTGETWQRRMGKDERKRD